MSQAAILDCLIFHMPLHAKKKNNGRNKSHNNELS